MLFLFNVLEVPGYVTVIIATFASIAGFFVGYVYLKSGIESKKADGYKSLFEIEEKKANKYENLYQSEHLEHTSTKSEYMALAEEYSQLAELFSKKSLILEAFTADYGGVAKAVLMLQEEGRLPKSNRMLENGKIHNTT